MVLGALVPLVPWEFWCRGRRWENYRPAPAPVRRGLSCLLLLEPSNRLALRLQLPVGRDTTSRSSDAIHVHLLVHLLTHLLVHPLIHLLASLLFHHHLPQLPSATVRGSRTNPNFIFYPGTFNVGPLETYQGPLGTFNEPWQLCVCGNLS